MMICGRSRRRLGRRARESDRARSAPASGCRRRAGRTCAGRAAAALRAGMPVATTSCPSLRSACASAARIFASSSTRRIEPVVHSLPAFCSARSGLPSRSSSAPMLRVTTDSCSVLAPAARSGRPCPRPCRLATAIVPPSPSMMCREIARPSPGAGPAGREVRVEDPRQIFCSNADAAIPDLDGDPLRAQSEGLQADRFGRRRRPAWPGRRAGRSSGC